MPFKIAIIGAGPAGLLLARLLHQADKGIEFEIFDSTSTLDDSKDYVLDVHRRNAKVALFQRCEGSIFAGAEIGKNKLREILCDGLPEKSLRWGCGVQCIDKSDGVKIRLNNGLVKQNFDLIVGADGIDSSVRPSLSDVQSTYSGIAGHIAHIPDAKTNSPALVELLDRGRLYSWSDGKSLVARYLANGSIALETWSARHRSESKSWQSEVQSAKGLSELYSSEYSGWHPSLQSLIQEADWSRHECADLLTCPIGFRWDHQPRLTLIGDAAHAMPHLGGEGLGIAFWDCVRLSKAIVDSASVAGDMEAKRGALDKKVARFEEDMFARGKVAQRATSSMMHAMFFVEGTPRTSMEKYSLAALEVENGYWRTMILSPIIYLYWSLFRWMYRP